MCICTFCTHTYTQIIDVTFATCFCHGHDAYSACRYISIYAHMNADIGKHIYFSFKGNLIGSATFSLIFWNCDRISKNWTDLYKSVWPSQSYLNQENQALQLLKDHRKKDSVLIHSTNVYWVTVPSTVLCLVDKTDAGLRFDSLTSNYVTLHSAKLLFHVFTLICC